MEVKAYLSEETLIAEDFKFYKFKGFASFILKEYLDEVTLENIQLMKAYGFPLMKHLFQISEEEFFIKIKESLGTFLNDILLNRHIETAINSLILWKEDKLPGVPKGEVGIEEISLGYSIRKKLFLKFLPLYTKDIFEGCSIIEELENFYSTLEKIAFRIYSEVKKEELQKHKDFTDSLINNLPTGIFAFNKDLKVTLWNKALEEIHKVKQEDILGKSFFEVFPSYEKSEEGWGILEVLNGNRAHIPEVAFKSKLGYCEITNFPLFNLNKEVIGGISIVNDITAKKHAEERLKKNKEELETTIEELKSQVAERKEIEESLRDRESKFRILAENSSDVISVHTPNGIFTYVSPSCEKLLGYKPDELIGKLIFELFHPDDLEKIVNKHLTVLESPHTQILTFRIKRKDGSFIWLESTGHAIHHPETNEVIEVQVNSRDVTLRKVIEEQLINSEAILMESQRIAHLGSWEWDMLNNDVTWTDEMYSILGYYPGELPVTFDTYLRHVHPEDRETVSSLIQNTLKYPKPYSVENRIITKHGLIKWIHTKGKIANMESGKPIKMAGTVIDITEQKLIEQKKNETQKILIETQQLAQIGSYEYDVMHNILYFSDELYKIFGLEKTDSISVEKCSKYILEEDISYLQELYTEAVKNGTSIKYEHKIKRKDGTIRILAGQANVILDSNGMLQKVKGFSQDITERKEVENKIKKSEALLKEAQELASIGNWEWELDSNKFFWSDQLYRIYGYNAEEITIDYEKLKERIPPFDWIKFDEIIKRVLLFKQAMDYEHRIIRKNGEERFISGKVKPLVDEQGNVTHITGIAQDITIRKKAEDEIIRTQQELIRMNNELEQRVIERTKELFFSDERFRLISRATNDAIWDWDLQNNSIWWNEGFKTLFGYSEKEIEPGIEFLYNRIHPEDAERIISEIHNIIDTGGEQWSAEYKFQKADGKYVYVLDRGQVLYNENGKAYRMLCSMVDLSALKQAQEELQETNKNLLKINTDLDNFIYTASHDLKAPISNIEGLLYALIANNCYNDNEIKSIIDMMILSVNRFKNTISELTEITKIQKNIIEDISDLNLFEILDDVKFSISNLIQEASAQIEADFSDCSIIKFSKKNLRSTLYNLVSNAIKYKHEDRKPVIKIKTSVTKGFVCLSVSDNGLGISEENKGKAFSMFKRLHDHVEGSGVGLYIVKRIIENEGGRIDLESTVGEGSTFKVFFRK